MNIETEKFLIDNLQLGRPLRSRAPALSPAVKVVTAYITCKNCYGLCEFNASERMMMLLVDCPLCKEHEAVPVSKLN